MGILSVDYIDGKQDTYKGLVFDLEEEEKRFDSGDPVIDYIDFLKWFSETSKWNFGYQESSSVNHFFMDGDKYYDRYFGSDGEALVPDTNMKLSLYPHFWVVDEMKILMILKSIIRNLRRRRIELCYMHIMVLIVLVGCVQSFQLR